MKDGSEMCASALLTGMLVSVSDERAVLGELLVTQLTDISRSTAVAMFSRRHDLFNQRAPVLAGSLRRPSSLSGATPARNGRLGSLDRRRDRLGVGVGDGGRWQPAGF